MNAARLTIAGLSGDSGKTMVSLSLISALKNRGLTIAPFKKGPDYIDSAWLSIAAGLSCRNLDTWMVDEDIVLDRFVQHSHKADISIIEGNRGLFDGYDVEGKQSTAGLAKLLQSPLVLVIDATKSTRTIAALVKGCQVFESELNLAGVILNKVAGPRHRKIITESIEKYCHIPVLGVIPKLGKDAKLIPGRHLGLVPPTELASKDTLNDKLTEIAETYFDMDRLIDIAKSAPKLGSVDDIIEETPESKVRVGYFKDSVFTFYYPENLEALEREGAQLIPISSLDDSKLPEIDGLYIGGGFPETHSQQLAGNHSLMESVKSAVENSMPIYAECGGLIYLCRSIKWNENRYKMSGVFPVDLEMHKKPVGHGYAKLSVNNENPFFPAGSEIKGHEFHYSGVMAGSEIPEGCLKIIKGVGLGNNLDGLLYNNCMACYTHIHADSAPNWAASFVALAEEYAGKNQSAGGGSFSAMKLASMA